MEQSERCPKCGAEMTGSRISPPTKVAPEWDGEWRYYACGTTLAPNGQLFSDRGYREKESEECIVRQRNLFAAAMAVDLEPWLFSRLVMPGRLQYYWVEYYAETPGIGGGCDFALPILADDFLPLAYSIAEYETQGDCDNG